MIAQRKASIRYEQYVSVVRYVAEYQDVINIASQRKWKFQWMIELLIRKTF